MTYIDELIQACEDAAMNYDATFNETQFFLDQAECLRTCQANKTTPALADLLWPTIGKYAVLIEVINELQWGD